MNDHDIRLIEIGQKEGYDRAVKEIVAWAKSIEKWGPCCPTFFASKIEAKFGGRDGTEY